jgi:DNA-binding NtrC family response regulator
MAIVLIIDAQSDFSAVLQQTLAAYGHEVLTARTGEDGLKSVQSRRPAAVLMDLKLSGGMTGLDTLAKLRAGFPQVPVVIVAKDVTVDEESRARELDVANVLRKGLKLDIIMDAVNHTLQHAGRPPQSMSAGKQAASSTILVVDDEVEIRELVGEFLGRRGYKIRTAASGEDGLVAIRKEPPDLVLLDIYMPGMNGVEMLRQAIRSYPKVGFIMLTASQDEPLLKGALDLGAFDVLSKPVDLKQLELAVLVKLALSAPD